MKKEYICPFCFNKQKMYEIDFACQDENCVDDDPVYVEYWDAAMRKRPTVTVGPTPGRFSLFKSKMPATCNCRTCSKETKTRLCKTCHSVLPHTISDYEDIIIAVIGAKSSGKSHYIGVLINEINKKIGNAYSSILQSENDDTIERYKYKFRNPLFKDKNILDVTPSAQADPDVRKPLLYTMKFNVGSKIKVVTLSLFDTAGEDLKAQVDMEKHTKYLIHSAGVICLVDPLQIDTVREEVVQKSPSTPLPIADPNAEPSDLIVRTTKLIRQGLNLKEETLISTPIAVSFSKVDAIKPLVDITSSLLRKSLHTETDAFNVEDFEAVNSEMRSLVQAWTEGNLTNMLQLNYQNYAFFGLSALGHAPVGKLDTIEPYRVEDPFLWLLWKNNVIKGSA